MHDPSFLHESEPRPIHRRHRRRRFYRSLLTVFLIVLGGWAILVLLAVGQLTASGMDLRDAISDTAEHASALLFHEAQEDVSRAARSLEELERTLFLLQMLWFLPGVDEPLTDLHTLFVSGQEVTSSLDSLLSLGQDVVQLAGLGEELSSTFHDLPSDSKRAVLQRLSTASSDFDLFSARIRIASDEFERLRGEAIVAPLLGVLDPFMARLSKVEEELATASVFARLLPELAGLDEDRTHLLLFLNNDELRPGGGFIGTYGILRVRDGEVLSLHTQDVYAVDEAAQGKVTVAAPEPLRRYNATPLWYFRDANWSPDFAQSAAQARTLFEAESDTHVDTVIGFTPALASALLDYLGSVEVGGQIFTAKNVPELIEYQVEKGFYASGIPVSQRKEILAELVLKVQERLSALPLSSWPEAFAILSTAIKAKQAAIFSVNEPLEQTIVQSGWGGVVRQRSVDALLYVDANLASLKSDPVVMRSLRYDIFRNPSGVWIGRTTMTYDHRGSFDWRTTRYRTYVRLYVPSGTKLIRAQGLQEGPEVLSELGMDVLGGFAVIEPGQERSVVFEYQLASGIVDAIARGAYTLDLFKQMGARDYALTLDLDFDKNVTQAVPPENRNEWGDDRYRLNTKLSQDLKLDVKL